MKKLLATTALVCALGISSNAHAQSLNYGTMQELFGEPVTTSANGSPQRASDVPMNMTIISREDIAKYPATEIPDILRHYPGVTVKQYNATNYSVGIRGYNQPHAERLLVLVNGRQVFADYFGLVNWSAIPVQINEIQQIEIVRGPNTALFGFNAVSGVINIVTVNPLYDDVDVVEADVGTNGYYKVGGVYTLQNKDEWAMRVSASNSNVDENPNTGFNDAASLYDEADVRDFNLDSVFNLNESTQMRIEAGRGNAEQNRYISTRSALDNEDRFSHMKVNLTADTDYGIIESTVYKNAIDTDYGQSGFNFDNDLIVAQLSNTVKVGASNTFRIAGEYRNNKTDHIIPALAAFAGGSSLIGTTTFNISSVSGLWFWNATDNLSTSLAARYDHVQSDLDGTILSVFNNPFSNEEYNNRYDEFGWNFGAAYKLTDADTLRFTAAKGVDLPSSFEVGFQSNTSAFNPNLDVSDVHDFQLGYERRVSSINGLFSLNTFYQVINELQGRTTDTPLSTSNLGDSEVYGFEVAVDGETDGGIRWGLNYSYSEVDDDVNAGSFQLEYEDLNSDHIVNAHIGYSPNEQWDYDLYASYQSEFDEDRIIDAANNTQRFTIDTEVVLDARIAYKPVEGVTVSLNGKGVLGDRESSAYGEDVESLFFLRAKYDF